MVSLKTTPMTEVLQAVANQPKVCQIADIVVAVLLSEKATYDEYRTFKVFESLPEVSVTRHCG